MSDQQQDGYDNEGRISVFENTKPKHDKSPHLNGNVQINGVIYNVSLWRNTSKSGLKYWAGSVSPKLKPGEVPDGSGGNQAQTTNPAVAAANSADDDDLPF